MTDLSSTLKNLLGQDVLKANSTDALKRIYEVLDSMPWDDELVPGAKPITVNQLVQGISYAEGRSSGTTILALRKLNGSELVDIIAKMWDEGARTIGEVPHFLRRLVVTQPTHQIPLI